MGRTRIRTLKPETWHDERVGKLSRDARLLFVGMITMADDEGRLLAEPSALLGHIFPFDRDAPRKIERWLSEITAAGVGQVYEIDGARYVEFRNWKRHQKINRPSPSSLPAPPRLQVVSDETDAFRNPLIA